MDQAHSAKLLFCPIKPDPSKTTKQPKLPSGETITFTSKLGLIRHFAVHWSQCSIANWLQGEPEHAARSARKQFILSPQYPQEKFHYSSLCFRLYSDSAGFCWFCNNARQTVILQNCLSSIYQACCPKLDIFILLQFSLAQAVPLLCVGAHSHLRSPDVHPAVQKNVTALRRMCEAGKATARK